MRLSRGIRIRHREAFSSGWRARRARLSVSTRGAALGRRSADDAASDRHRQVISTLVAIPVGLASVYSIYRSNFTVEARCETLRGSIISMLDKSTDASTLRMLVRRDVVTFETNCGAVDPDAVKAFKALLTAKATPKVTPAEPSKQVVQEPVRKPVEVAKPAAPKAAAVPSVVEAKPSETKPAETKPVETKSVETKPAATKPVRRDAETSDANWINSVRDALTHAPAEHERAAEAPHLRRQRSRSKPRVQPSAGPRGRASAMGAGAGARPSPQCQPRHRCHWQRLRRPHCPSRSRSRSRPPPRRRLAADHPVPPARDPRIRNLVRKLTYSPWPSRPSRAQAIRGWRRFRW